MMLTLYPFDPFEPPTCCWLHPIVHALVFVLAVSGAVRISYSVYMS